jgi:hypothetical protein
MLHCGGFSGITLCRKESSVSKENFVLLPNLSPTKSEYGSTCVVNDFHYKYLRFIEGGGEEALGYPLPHHLMAASKDL